jgi:hypothetical protein
MPHGGSRHRDMVACGDEHELRDLAARQRCFWSESRLIRCDKGEKCILHLEASGKIAGRFNDGYNLKLMRWPEDVDKELSGKDVL